jgi:hypothetical protein
MKPLVVFLITLVTAAAAAQAPIKCEALINGYKVHSVYIIGTHFNGVVWAYKHIGEATCLTPVTDATKADAILDIYPNGGSPAVLPSDAKAAAGEAPSFVSCHSSGGSSSCLDDQGNELTVSCDGNGNCSSYYGPSLTHVVGQVLYAWVSSAWYQSEAKLYTPDHKLLWKSEGTKGQHWYDFWTEKLREATFPIDCKIPAGNGTENHFRKWASEKCNVEFAPLVSIDIKANAQLAAKNQKQDEVDEMKRNAAEAAQKQKN